MQNLHSLLLSSYHSFLGSLLNWFVLLFRAPKMGLEEDFAAAAEDISNNVNKTLSDDELKEV